MSYVPKFEPDLFRNWYIAWSYSFHVKLLGRFMGNFTEGEISLLVRYSVVDDFWCSIFSCTE